MLVTVPSELLRKSVAHKLQTVANVASALGLDEGMTIEYELSKASPAERITAPHLNRYVWDLERLFYALRPAKKVVDEILSNIGIGKRFQKAWQRPIYRTDGTPMTDEEMARLEQILADALEIPVQKVRELILKGAIAGKLAGSTPMGKPLKIDLSKLPKTLREAVKAMGLTQTEVRSIQWAWNLATIHVTRAQERAKSELKEMIVEGMMNRMHPRQLAARLFHEAADKDEGFLNRDWERLSLTEMNRAHSDGFLSGVPDEEYVVGISHADACAYCKKLIHHKVYLVTHDPPQDYSILDPGSSEYKRAAQMWENRIWVGKTNVGRGLSARKRMNGKLEDREHHERAMPTIPLHPSCRCVWTKWLKDLNYIKAGEIQVAIDDQTRQERQEWLKKNPMPR